MPLFGVEIGHLQLIKHTFEVGRCDETPTEFAVVFSLGVTNILPLWGRLVLRHSNTLTMFLSWGSPIRL
jgi:hypothetical protein